MKKSTEIYKILELRKTYWFVSEAQGKKATGAFWERVVGGTLFSFLQWYPGVKK